MHYIVKTDDPEVIDWLRTRLPYALGGQQVAERTDGGVLITDVEPLRRLTADEDGSITDDGGQLTLWVEGDPYPLHPVREG